MSRFPGRQIPFPISGLVEDVAYGEQPPNTTPDALNVRGYDTLKARLRGGQRPGHRRHLQGDADQPVGTVVTSITQVSQQHITDFDGSDTTELDDGSIWEEHFQETALGTHPNAFDADAGATNRWELLSNEGIVDWAGATASMNQARGLKKLGSFSYGAESSVVLKASITTFTGEGVGGTDKVKYYAGFVFRLNSAGNEYFFAGWERTEDLDDHRMVLLKHEGTTVTEIATGAALGATDASQHTLEVRIGKNRVEIDWDAVNSITYRLTASDGLAGELNDSVGLLQSRVRDTNNWTGTDTASFDDFEIYSASITEDAKPLQEITQADRVVDPRTVTAGDILNKEEFTGADGAEIGNGTFHEYAGAETIASGTIPPNAYESPSPVTKIYTILDNRALADWSLVDGSGSQANNSARILEHRNLTFGPDAAFVARLTIYTKSDADTTDNARYFKGILFRGDPATSKYFFVAWRRDDGAQTQSLVVRDQTGADLVTTVSLTGNADDQPHELKLAVNGAFMQVSWDGALKITHDLSGDGNDGLQNNRVAIFEQRIRDSGGSNWSAGEQIGSYDDFTLQEGLELSSNREIQLVAIAGGTLKQGDRIDGLNIPAGGKDVLNADVRRIESAFFLNKLFICDGFTYKYYDAVTNEVTDWDASTDGELPGGEGSAGPADGNSRCQIIALYRGRIVLSGKEDEPYNWFMSAVGDPFDYGYEVDPLGGEPVAGKHSSGGFGESGDIVTALIPYHEEQLIFGGVNTIRILTADPLNGGQFHLLSQDIGIAGPRAWAVGPNKVIYFFGTNGLYQILPNTFNITSANRISSERLDRRFQDIDFAANDVSLAWDVRRHGLWIYVVPVDGSTAAEAFFWDFRRNAFWPDSIPLRFGPTAVHGFRGDRPEERTVLLGGRDSRIREADDAAVDDDGDLIQSHVVYPPLMAGPTNMTMALARLDAILADGSGAVEYQVRGHRSPETVLETAPRFAGTWRGGGPQASVFKRASGSAISIRLSNGEPKNPWAIESMVAHAISTGVFRSRKAV